MAGFGWSMRHGNMHELNHARKRPYATAQIACRICDQAFFSTQALIDHIETHMIEDETAASRRQHELNLMLSQRGQFADPSQHNFALPEPQPMRPPTGSRLVSQVLQVRNPFCGATTRVNVVPPLGLLSMRKEGFEFGPQLPPKSSVQEPSSDCTKPFLDQLQQIVPDVVKLQVENEDGNNKLTGDAEMLDLTLKL